MTKLVFYANIKFVTGEGTPGESFPRFNLGLFSHLIADEEVLNYKQMISANHRENMKRLPISLQKAFPEVSWIMEGPYQPDYQI